MDRTAADRLTADRLTTTGLTAERPTAGRPLSDIANDVIRNWRRLSYGAVSSVAAMRELRDLDDRYGDHTGRAVVRDFLGHAGPWRGPVARRVKAELASMLRP